MQSSVSMQRPSARHQTGHPKCSPCQLRMTIVSRGPHCMPHLRHRLNSSSCSSSSSQSFSGCTTSSQPLHGAPRRAGSRRRLGSALCAARDTVSPQVQTRLAKCGFQWVWVSAVLHSRQSSCTYQDAVKQGQPWAYAICPQAMHRGLPRWLLRKKISVDLHCPRPGAIAGGTCATRQRGTPWGCRTSTGAGTTCR